MIANVTKPPNTLVSMSPVATTIASLRTSTLQRLVTPPVAGYGFRDHRRLSVCVSVHPHDTSKTVAARITKLDTEMFHHETWKIVYFGV